MDIVWILAGAAFFIGSCGWLAFLNQLARGGVIVDWTTLLAAVITAFLVVYLLAALLKPEMFS